VLSSCTLNIKSNAFTISGNSLTHC
jgi:hypothetical protein